MKKGFTLVELIACFSIITVVSIALFKTVIVIQQKQTDEIHYNSYVSFTSILNNTIQKDLLTNRIISITKNSTNNYTITYETTTKNLIISDGYITYGSTKEELPSGYTLYTDMTITTYISDGDGYNSYVLIDIPLKSNSSVNLDDLKYIYQFDSKVTIIPTIIES